jgi:hypothetical protein
MASLLTSDWRIKRTLSPTWPIEVGVDVPPGRSLCPDDFSDGDSGGDSTMLILSGVGGNERGLGRLLI